MGIGTSASEASILQIRKVCEAQLLSLMPPERKEQLARTFVHGGDSVVAHPHPIRNEGGEFGIAPFFIGKGDA